MSWRDRILERDTNACTHAGAGTFCPECGRSMVPPPRYSFTEMLGPPTDIWLKKGFRRTLFGLFIHPGRSIRTFLFQDRDHLVKPADVQAAVGPGGVLELLLQARQEGKVRALDHLVHVAVLIVRQCGTDGDGDGDGLILEDHLCRRHRLAAVIAE